MSRDGTPEPWGRSSAAVASEPPARADGSTAALSVSVVICTYATERTEDTILCVASALRQDPRPAEVIVVVDHNPSLAKCLRRRLPEEVVVVPNAGAVGLSSARNTAIGLTDAELIAFLDDDAIAAPGWLSGLLSAFDDPGVAGVGGHATAAWHAEQPGWFPDELLWVVGCSFRGQAVTGNVRNPLGCSMAFRAELFNRVGVFDEQIGRLGSRPLGCEETELCIRAERAIPGVRFVIAADSEVIHRVPPSRETPGYLVRRCFYEGLSKARVRHLGDRRSLDSERSYVSRALSLAIIRAALRSVLGPRRRHGLGQIAAISAALLAAGIGFLVGAVTVLTAPPRQSRAASASRP